MSKFDVEYAFFAKADFTGQIGGNYVEALKRFEEIVRADERAKRPEAGTTIPVPVTALQWLARQHDYANKERAPYIAMEAVAMAQNALKASATDAATVRRAEVRLNDDKTLDEVVTKDGDQLERMDYNHWFVEIGDVAVWLHAKGKITASYERRNGGTDPLNRAESAKHSAYPSAPTHTDHPLRHYDRTCPGCNAARERSSEEKP